jgi:hypothetical protein
MIDEETLARINGKYVCPPDAGPDWRAAMEAGIDMSLIEENLRLSQEERLEMHQRALNTVLMVDEARERSEATR